MVDRPSGPCSILSNPTGRCPAGFQIFPFPVIALKSEDSELQDACKLHLPVCAKTPRVSSLGRIFFKNRRFLSQSWIGSEIRRAPSKWTKLYQIQPDPVKLSDLQLSASLNLRKNRVSVLFHSPPTVFFRPATDFLGREVSAAQDHLKDTYLGIACPHGLRALRVWLQATPDRIVKKHCMIFISI